MAATRPPSVELHPAQVLDAAAALFLVDALTPGRLRHLGLAARRRLHRRLANEIGETITRLRAVARLVAVFLRDDDDHALFRKAAAGEPHQPYRDVVRQRGRAPRVEPELHRARYLVDVLPARPGGAHEGLLQFGVLDR